jgi:hypothetical protein
MQVISTPSLPELGTKLRTAKEIVNKRARRVHIGLS